MAQPKNARSMNKPKRTSAATTELKISKALAQASLHAKKQLASQGLKLPTQSWTGSAVRNPAI